jgi:pyrroline-5-carboxylate reductase
MGGAMVRAWATRYHGLKPAEILVVDPDRAAREAAEAVGARAAGHAEKAMLAELDTVVIAVKPQLLDGIAPSLAPILPPGVLLISIVAGVTIAKLKQAFPRAFVVRAMPNRPTEIGKGAAAFVAHPGVTEGQRERARAMLEAGGVVVELKDEALMDVVTALSGSGPAYVLACCAPRTASMRSWSARSRRRLGGRRSWGASCFPPASTACATGGRGSSPAS